MVEKSNVTRSVLDLGLITADDPVAHVLTAILHTGVAVPYAELQPQLEIPQRTAAPDKERIAAGWFCNSGLASNDAILNRPQAHITVPAAQVFAVEWPDPLLG